MTESAASNNENAQALAGLRVLDLSRILAGPTATQLLADLGAEVIKIERPGAGDDTRGWGPPFVCDAEGQETRESAYYMSANRGKHSVAVNIADPRGQDVIRQLAATCDIVVENFKAGDLARYGLDYSTLKKINPRLVYCSISGFGQTGPNAGRAGYDFLVQGEAGLMSLTGNADGPPMKAGVGIADLLCGMYATVGILAAVQARHTSGVGQYIDISLMDAQIAMLVNQGVAHLTDGQVPPRRGNDHPTIVPYGTFPTLDGTFILAVGNDGQFERFVTQAGAPGLATDPRFATNRARVCNRDVLIPLISAFTAGLSAENWLSVCKAHNIPAGPVNDLAQVFASEQVAARQMKISLPHPVAEKGYVDLIGNPLKMSDTPVKYTKAPPMLGQDTIRILADQLGLSDETLRDLAGSGVIEGHFKE
ncbi:CaiB/BaiF CoA-transferase family protein [Paracoccus sp. JM45]|uniref:CaiB/BaiF CoA transferase family protein n=1 Tax=Paracoccus sp. JM45 TaxID=2283626 RepID=UPI000E6D48CE|nr:CoA transferase [Paracoccus sp. JM45]RJE79636.1 CoA transferase [Paracoccus sp. JM45]